MRSLGLVGVGPWGRRYIDTIAQRNDVRIAAYTRSSAGVDSAIPGATRCNDWRALIELARGGELEGVIVATTPENQAEVAAAALSAGVPAVVEKPLGLSSADARHVLEQVQSASAASPLLVNYIHLFAPAYRCLKALVQDRDRGAGALVAIDTAGGNLGPFRNFSSLYDYGAHDVALCLDLVGAGSAFRLREARRLPAAAGGELHEVLFELDDVRVTMQVGNGMPTKTRRFAASTASERRLVYDDVRPHPFKLLDGQKPIPVDPAPPLDLVITEFLERCAQFRAGHGDSKHEARAVEFSVRVAEILDEMSGAIGAS